MVEEQKSWLEWAREVEAIAQTGLHFNTNEFDRQRYQRLLQISAEVIGSKIDLDAQILVDIYSSQKGYATPKVDVRAAVFQDGRLLMAREKADGGWTMPGGWADVGDIPSQAAEREAREETGYLVKARKLIGVYDANRSGPLELFHAYKLLYLCELIGGESSTSIETDEIAFFGIDEIPSHLSGERTLPRHIEDAFAVLANPNKEAVFD